MFSSCHQSNICIDVVLHYGAEIFSPLDWWNTTVHRLSGGAPTGSGTSDCSKNRHQPSEEGRCIHCITMASIKFWSCSILPHLVKTMSTGTNLWTKLSCRSRRQLELGWHDWYSLGALVCLRMSTHGELSILVNGVAAICNTLSCMISKFIWQSQGLIRQATVSQLYYSLKAHNWDCISCCELL